MLSITDPKDGREKLVLSNYVGGGRGALILMDVGTCSAEEIPLPGDNGAWAVCSQDDRYLIAGTNGEAGLICRFDLLSRCWAEPLHHENTTYHWNVARGSDSLLYFTTYPTAEVLQYDPLRHTLNSIGRPTGNPANFYSREICGTSPGWIFVTGGFDQCHVSAWNIDAQKWMVVAASTDPVRFSIAGATADFLFLDCEGTREVYSIPDFRRMASGTAEAMKYFPENVSQGSSEAGLTGFSARLRDGRMAGVAGQEIFLEDGRGQKEFRRIPLDPPATVMHKSFVLDGNGDLWGPSSFGQTIFRYSTSDGAVWNSLGVCDHMGEVYGMVHLNNLLFMACYAGGDHVVYDPTKPWDQRNNINPRTLKKQSDYLCRAVGGCVVGPDGAVWTGWRAKYGTYGGALSRIDPATYEIAIWKDPVPGQTVMGVAADEEFLYFTTNPSAEGLPVKADEPGWFGIWEPGIGLRAKYQMGLGEQTAGLVVVSDTAFIMQGDRLAVFDTKTLSFGEEIVLSAPCSKLLKLADGILAAIGGQKIVWIHTMDRRILGEEPLETGAFGAVAAPDGKSFYYGAGMDLYRFQAAHLWEGRI